MWEPSYVSLTQFKNYIKINSDDTTDDEFLALDISAASRAIDHCCSDVANGLGAPRQFGSTDTPEARYYSARWDDDQVRWIIEIDDVDASFVDTMQVFLDVDNSNTFTTELTGYILRPRNAPKDLRPYTQISILNTEANQPTFFTDSVKVTSRWGWLSIPDIVIRATLIQAHRFNKRRTAPFGVAGSPNNSSEVSLDSFVDPDIKAMLKGNNLIKLGWTM